MSADMAIRIASSSNGGKAAAEPPGDEGRGFPAALTAAGSGRPVAGGGHGNGHRNASDHSHDDADGERDARTEASDPALAALAAALLPGSAPAPAGGEAEHANAPELVISAPGRAAASGSVVTLDATLDDALDASLASTGDESGPAAGKDLLQNLTRELALAREPGPLRVGTDSRAALSGEALPASAVTHAATQLAGMSATVAAAATAEQALRLPVGAPRWADELGSRLVQMSMRGQQEGSLTLAPEHMGPLEVRISMNQNTAHVWFGAQHVDTRAVLAETLPRLREMFAEAGLSLGHAGVSQEAPGREAGQGLPPQRRLDAQLAMQATTAPTAVSRPVSGLLDLYA